ncbi:NAD(P)/FAD-dependent oxidoreductase [Polymorphobacter fuscus]|uniref:D-amino-acid oxidase n=1 Tax=Sandarakinorhabdus fusca TaxID=1439888 RepID=A0A7C9GPM9_9SPHN|nr:FAD-dependent oxidoreductase [Polymorphobacter fuscus]KAB7646417.1 FAD-binding oxidoreductase [Polymorphobacter fuscus]MQT17655.1 FAD-dependent oxidoreductase [Polymorphobacter fuscus]NJC09800.1 glycine/D-amino acid oxidase-like deaminating enzyme [Polymorphobacter fuscus]
MITSRRTLMAGIGGLGLSGCVAATPRLAAAPGFAPQPLAPLRMDPDRITHITVCLRPFRAAGPRMDIETIGGKRVVHNYGHGGSGWSLSWGAAAIAARNAMADGRRDIAVIGCGAIGITTALTLQRAGARVTIYARERLPQTRSARATGTWSPDSRIADANAVTAQFPALWEAMARASFPIHQSYVGLPGDPVVWSDRYTLLSPGLPRPPRPAGAIHFAEYGERIADIVPPFRSLSRAQHPFPVDTVRHGTSMQFNVAALGQRLMQDFLIEGGHIEQAHFETPADFARLSQPVVVNCTGYGARALMRDDSIVPVRGQIAWLAPQPEVRYGLYYRSVSILPRNDGIVVQYVGDSDMWGYGIDSETPDRGEAERAIAVVAALF